MYAHRSEGYRNVLGRFESSRAPSSMRSAVKNDKVDCTNIVLILSEKSRYLDLRHVAKEAGGTYRVNFGTIAVPNGYTTIQHYT